LSSWSLLLSLPLVLLLLLLVVVEVMVRRVVADPVRLLTREADGLRLSSSSKWGLWC